LVEDEEAQALDIAQRHEGPIHLLLADVVMPQMGGCALTESLALLRAGNEVLYMSGYTEHAIASGGVLDPGILLLQKTLHSGNPDAQGARGSRRR